MTLLLLLGACGGTVLKVGDSDDTDADTDADTDTDTDTDSDTDTDTDTDSDTDTDTDTDTGTVPIEYDCDNLPIFNLGDTTLDEARGYHGLVFDDDGHLIGWDSRTALIRSAYDGTRELFVPGIRSAEQMDRLTDGDFVVADSANGRLLRVTPEGGSETLASDVGSVYGVTTGPDGMLYIADGGVHRVNPATGEKTTLLDQPRQWMAHSLNFSLDSTRLYIGTIGTGTVYYLDLDENLDPLGRAEVYAEGVGSGWHDAVELDACGNLYVPEYYTSALYRIGVDGSVVLMVDNTNSRLYGHGAVWGSGIGGWRADTLYQPQPYGGSHVREVVIGLPSGDTVRTWNGAVVPW